MTKKDVWFYHRTHSFVDAKTGEKISMLTQLYRTGVYAIVNNDSSQQYVLLPKDLMQLEKNLKKAVESGEIMDLEFHSPITVVKDEKGLFTEKLM